MTPERPTVNDASFRLLIERGWDVLVLLAADGTIRYISPNVQSLLGYAPEELIGAVGIRTLVHPDDQLGSAGRLRRMLDEPDWISHVDLRIIRKDGGVLWIELTSQNRLGDPNIGMIVANFRDITERMKARIERERLRWVTDHAEEGYAITDSADRLHYLNAQARLYLNVPIGPLDVVASAPLMELAKRTYHCEPEASWEGWPDQMDDALNRTRYFIRPETSQARALWLEIRILVSPDNWNGLRLIRIKDVTQAMTNKRDLWTFQSMASHKIRTPLSAVQTGLAMLEQSTPPLSPEDTISIIRSASAGAVRLRGVIEDVLDYIRLPALAEAGGECSVRRLGELVRRVGADLKIERVMWVLDETLSEMRFVLSDLAMEWVLIELFENSKRFHPRHDPEIQVTVTRLGIDRFRMRILDDGLHLTPEQLMRIWTPFFQGEKYFTGQQPGSGLGLAMIAALTWEAGGTCRLTNRADRPGIVVELVIPLRSVHD